MRYYQNFSLIKYNSFRLNSTAKEIWFPETLKELAKILQKLNNKDFKVLARGTNIIMNKEIKKIICLKEMPKLSASIDNSFIVFANTSTISFIKTVLDKNFGGVEGLLGIPGTIGGAIVMNAGSGKYTISDYLVKVYTLDRNGKIKKYNREDLKLARRYSIFQDKDEIITGAIFKFFKLKVNKKAIKKAIEYRKNLPKEPSAGGLFINWHALKSYEKELRTINCNNLVISKYLNIVTNKGNATFEEVNELINKIKTIVKTKLKLEVKIWKS